MNKIILEREKCIGCGSCQALCPKYFEMSEDGKAFIKNAKRDPKTGSEELEVNKVECGQEAVDSCPVQCIHLK